MNSSIICKLGYRNAIFPTFEITYGFNLLTPLELSALTSNEQNNLDSAARVKYVRDLNEKVRLEIIKKNEHFAWLANKGKK